MYLEEEGLFMSKAPLIHVFNLTVGLNVFGDGWFDHHRWIVALLLRRWCPLKNRAT